MLVETLKVSKEGAVLFVKIAGQASIAAASVLANSGQDKP